MDEGSDHRTCVTVWMRRAGKGLPPSQLVESFDAAFAALWDRAHQTLGDITLAAIVDRILYTAAERYPVLAALHQDAKGVRWGDPVAAFAIGPEQLAQAIQFVLVEFLTVLGNLTADILTPPLHAELAKLTPGKPNGVASTPPSRTTEAAIETETEGTES